MGGQEGDVGSLAVAGAPCPQAPYGCRGNSCCRQAGVHTLVLSLLCGTLFPGAATTMTFVFCRT